MYTLSSEQRQAIGEGGTPLPVIDDVTGEAYMLLAVEFLPDIEGGGYSARVPGVPAYGEGERKEEAIIALTAALNGYIDAFGD